MELNGTLIGQIIFVLTLVVVFFTLRFAKGKTTNLPLVGFYALVLNLIFAPAGWIYCWYWSTKPFLSK
ncbi:hypothetical protein EGC86_12705 [Shewanella frigidimarina]|jgi:hypothetical protein|nr:hypothetical protein CXF88_17930 [Shewanella sp. ALD9]RPA61891.1 hypothetical protein EGC86_12705 [Shewanella frigidimarina]|tara:strand:- start:959 stop:1162 length:204 start_codon:yes stop_codon:yes gene_type:complete